MIMARGAKRKRIENDASRTKNPTAQVSESPVQRDLLAQCYPIVRTLKDHILAALPSSSRLRRRKITSLGSRTECSEIETRLTNLLDTTLVCTHGLQPEDRDIRWEQWLSFSQIGDESNVTLSGGISASLFSQPDIVDFVIWLLFSREKKAGGWPKNLLCDGFRRSVNEGTEKGAVIPGIFSLYPNCNAKTLKEDPWPHLLALLGRSGERLMIDLLTDCSVFVKVQSGSGNYYQICGVALSELAPSSHGTAAGSADQPKLRKPSDITLVRSRIFFAKPALSAKGVVHSGYKSIHLLNRHRHRSQLVQYDASADSEASKTLQTKNNASTAMVLMYTFPRQFGLHNVFTSKVDTAQTAQKFQDYTLREEEISSIMRSGKTVSAPQLPKVPKRLRGPAWRLIQRLQVLHSRCSYAELLRHYCPSTCEQPKVCKETTSKRETVAVATAGEAATKGTNPSRTGLRSKKRCSRKPQLTSDFSFPAKTESLVDLACATSQVSAFCQAVLSRIIPSQFWGDGDTKDHNLASFLRKVDHFIKLRRFETMSLHEIVQGLKVTDLAWLQPPGQEGQKTSQTDMTKRHEIFHEFMYFVFDSLLIPLIRSNFYVTESNTHGNQVFYFRHDVWRRISEPAMAAIKENMFEDVKAKNALQILDSRRLGFSHIRLLPKGNKLRPIMNLRRRNVTRGGSKVLGQSVNSVLGPVHNLLKLEKDIAPSRLGSTLFSVGDMYDQIKDFKDRLGSTHERLYFAKLDVKAAFDTIPQAAIIQLMSSVPSHSQYDILKHAEVKPGERALFEPTKTATKPIRRWHSTAVTKDQCAGLPERIESQLGRKKQNVVFVDSVVRKTHDVHSLMRLLTEHVTHNLVKVGKKYYRQSKGIPQGSVLSSFLCNYFYADLERRHLGFLKGHDCLLLRLIDDFLLITLDRSKAVRFVETMHRGVPEYGVEVSPAKTLIDFDMKIDGRAVHKTREGSGFPYCGTLIDRQTLDISKDREKDKGNNITNSISVEFGRSPGQNFQRKTLQAFKIQSHLMYFDTSHNSATSVRDSMRGAFGETACKMWAYIRRLPGNQRPTASLIIRTIVKVAEVAFLILTGKSRKMRYERYACDIRKGHITSIAYASFLHVLGKKQTGYDQVVAWLRKETGRLGPG